MCYISTVYISATPAEVYSQFFFEKYATEKASLHKQSCMLRCAIYVNSSKREELFMDICHPIIFQISKRDIWCMYTSYMIQPYSKSIRQHRPGSTNTKNYVSLTCMSMIEPATGWFEIVCAGV